MWNPNNLISPLNHPQGLKIFEIGPSLTYKGLDI